MGFGKSVRSALPIVTFLHLNISYHNIPNFEAKAVSCINFDTYHEEALIKLSPSDVAGVFPDTYLLFTFYFSSAPSFFSPNLTLPQILTH